MNEIGPHSTAFHNSTINGVYIESAVPPPNTKQRDPIIFVHGGLHGSWCFTCFQNYLAEHGWESHALNFFNHYHSASLPLEHFINRGSVECTGEIRTVASTLNSPPILVAHGWGGIVAQKYAEENPVRALVLLAPVVSAEVGVTPGNAPPIDLNSVFPVPPFEVARDMFLGGLDDELARHFYSLLCPESPKCINEARDFSVCVDSSKIHCPILAFGAENDYLVPADYVKVLASRYGATFHLLKGRGHNLLLEPEWRETANVIRDWLKSC